MENCKLENQIISLDEFNSFSGDYEDSPEVKLDKIRTLDAAQEIVEDYLGYRILSNNHNEVFEGLEGHKVFLHCVPVQYVNQVIVNKEEIIMDAGFVFDKDSVYLDRRLKPCDKVKIFYTSGYDRSNVPALIRQTILRIATLLYMEGAENIGVSSKSYSDGSRTFINYSNFDKYLKPLLAMKSVRL